MGFRNVQFQICVSYLMLHVVVRTENIPVVTVAEGRLRGVNQLSRDGNLYHAFLGVPYASVPVRFEPPQPVNPWSGIRDATKFGPLCPQLLRGTVIGELECLQLNVFSKNLTGNSPVIVYIHGGAFMTGSGNQYGASHFLGMDMDIVLITINYRLGALGFLSTGDGVLQGNNGLHDQQMCLVWLKANVHVFGGDKSCITIMGESAGLFHRAIAQSGSALDPEHFEPNPLDKAIALAESLDCPTFPTTDLADCLRAIDFRKIVQVKLTKWHLDPLVEYPPTLDVPKPGQPESELFLTESPMTLLQEGRFNKVPFVIGITQDEGLLFHSAYILRKPELQRSMNEDWNYVSPITLYYDNLHIPSEEKNMISRKIRGFYFGDRKIGTSTSRNLTNLYSDRLFNWGARTTALLQSKFVPVYIYIFGFLGDFSMLQLFYSDLFQGPIAPTHGDDLQYFFNSTRYPLLTADSRAEKISKTLIQLWSSFAASGNMMMSLDTLKVPWLPIGPEEIRKNRLKWCYIDIDSKILTREPFGDRLEFWDKISRELQNKSYQNKHEDSTTLYSKSVVGNNKDEF